MCTACIWQGTIWHTTGITDRTAAPGSSLGLSCGAESVTHFHRRGAHFLVLQWSTNQSFRDDMFRVCLLVFATGLSPHKFKSKATISIAVSTQRHAYSSIVQCTVLIQVETTFSTRYELAELVNGLNNTSTTVKNTKYSLNSNGTCYTDSCPPHASLISYMGPFCTM